MTAAELLRQVLWQNAELNSHFLAMEPHVQVPFIALNQPAVLCWKSSMPFRKMVDLAKAVLPLLEGNLQRGKFPLLHQILDNGMRVL